MRVLILGVAGMLGHKVWQECQTRFDTWGTVRGGAGGLGRFGIFDTSRVLERTDAFNMHSLTVAIDRVRPDAVINCIGIVKQADEADDPVSSIIVNALFPQRLASLCQAVGARLVHISTDCVFSGAGGNYTEDSVPDPLDIYGRTKLLGEVAGAGCVTLRTSMIGRELAGSRGIVEWFLSNRGGRVNGFTRAFFSGVTTLHLAELIAGVLENQQDLEGLYHVAAERISKNDLLHLLNESFVAGVEIEPVDHVDIDRTLDGSRFGQLTGWTAPSWREMVSAMAADASPYDKWRT